MIYQVAIGHTLHDCFDYLAPEQIKPSINDIGKRVTVPFQKRNKTGFIINLIETSQVAHHKLKPIIALFDEQPVLDRHILALCQWIRGYYHAPMSEIIHCALPKSIREGKPLEFKQRYFWQLTELGQTFDLDDIKKAPKQYQALRFFHSQRQATSEETIKEQLISRQIIKQLEEKKLISSIRKDQLPARQFHAIPKQVSLNDEQRIAVEAIIADSEQYNAFLLQGITGSGKTEVYLHTVEHYLLQKKQCLILVPEIGLTPQLLQRFEQRFPGHIAVIHSGLNDRERLEAWLMAKNNLAQIVIGTRSAIFTPMPNLGLIIIDEEHDLSYKQLDGIRYNAHDVAIVRAHQNDIAIVLGSATPSLESLHNVNINRFARLILQQRAGAAKPAGYHLIDLRNQKLTESLSSPLITAIKEHLAAGNQVLLFINRRGYAPTLFCNKCGWIKHCKQCDANLTLHLQNNYMQCHHCGYTTGIAKQCDGCENPSLVALGAGTERLEDALNQLFPEHNILRIDKDNTRNKHAFSEILKKIHAGDADILLGTQMLAKGHDFPNVTLVGIINADSGFYSASFRASEQLGQLITQVAGRSGRAEKIGEVFIQTYLPENPLLNLLIRKGYHAYATHLLKERKQSDLPPYSHMAILRCEAKFLDDAIMQLNHIKQTAQALNNPDILIMGPIPALMAKRAGIYRAQLLIKSQKRGSLHQVLAALTPTIQQIKIRTPHRLILDVDPLDVL